MPTGTVKWFNATKGYRVHRTRRMARRTPSSTSPLSNGRDSARCARGRKCGSRFEPGRDGKSSAEELSVVE